MPRLCLNSIVKNEATRIERMLKSVLPWISYWVIVDTGSTDGTQDVIKKFFADNNVRGRLLQAPFYNWSQARNNALLAARQLRRNWDYLLLVDADMELIVEDKKCFDKLIGISYDMQQRAGTLRYLNRRLVRNDATGRYLGVTHEYLDVEAAGCVQGAYFLDHADGSNRPEKFIRDIRLLSTDLITDPKNGRSWFYLAQSYRDAGQPENAANAYKKRVEIGGWDEEVWYAQYSCAHCLKDMGDEDGFVREMLKAYQMRPSRAETLYDLAKFYREKPSQQALSLLFSEAGMNKPYSKDALFVSDYVYTVGCKEEFAICAFYDADRRDEGYAVCNELTLDKRGTSHTREQAKNNMYFYIQPLKKLAPSFAAQKLDFEPPDNYVPMNPSIMLYDGSNVDARLVLNLRAVNYNITPDGRYEIRAGDGSINAENPIDTRNFLIRLNDDLSMYDTREITWQRPAPAFNLVTGLEDVRLFQLDGFLHGVACVREQNAQGRCQQVRFCLEGSTVSEWQVLPSKQDYEKNWMPFYDKFVYRIGSVIDTQGNLTQAPNVHLDVGNLSGGSQVIWFNTARLALVHEARHDQVGKRYYQHRFVMMDNNAGLLAISKPFVFHDRQIEFAAGLCWHPDGKRLIISYGVRDAEAWIATIDQSDVWSMLT